MGWRLAVLTSVIALFLLQATEALAEEPTPLSASPSPVVLEANGHGTVVLTNQTGIEMTLNLSAVDKDGNALPGASITPPPGGKLGPGASATVTFTVPKETTGSLVVVAAPTGGLPEGAVVRVALVTAETAKAAVTEWTFVNTHPGGNSGTQLPLTATCGSLGLAKPTSPGPASPTPIGTVQSEGESLTVSGICSAADAKELDLSISAPQHDGRVYKGKIKVGEGEVELTVEDKLCAALAALLIFIGIGLALGVGSYQSGKRPALQLIREIRIVENFVSPNNKKNLDKLFRDAATELDLPDEVRTWTIAAAVSAELTALRSSLQGLPNEEELKAKREALVKLELELREWPKVANLLGELKLRGPRLAILTHYYGPILDRTLKRRGSLDLAAMRDVKTAASEAVALANEWPSEQIAAAQILARNLPGNVTVPASFEVALQQIDSAATAEEAKKALKAFWKAKVDLQDAAKAEEITASAMVVAGSTTASESVFEPAETEDPAVAAASLASTIFAIDLIVLGILLAVALVGGMQTLWVGKSFGGFWDIAAALAWGLGAGAIGKPLSEGLTNVGRSWIAAGTVP
jgi:phosphoglycolate phosphatase-like HAD superfamily hydrolase